MREYESRISTTFGLKKHLLDGVWNSLSITIPDVNKDVCREAFYTACFFSYEEGRLQMINEVNEEAKLDTTK